MKILRGVKIHHSSLKKGNSYMFICLRESVVNHELKFILRGILLTTKV